jgi:hypothetical protein
MKVSQLRQLIKEEVRSVLYDHLPQNRVFESYFEGQQSKLRLNIRESIDSELEKIKEFGYEEVERFTTPPYTLMLLHNTQENIYEISLTTDEEDFTTFDSQIKRRPKYDQGDGGVNFMAASGELISKVREWLKKYGDLFVGSFNERRTNKYHRIFSSLKFTLTKIQYNDNIELGLPSSWDFKILSEN